MSPTMTITVPRTRMHRSKTLSLAAPRGPSFTTLPTELILDILERALLASPKTGHTYARISKHIAHLFDQILYRTVVLASSRQIALFARTLASKPPSFLPAHVKRLAITWDAPTTVPITTRAHLTTIIHACAGTRALAVPQELMSICLEVCPPTHNPAAHDHPIPMPADITIGAFADMAPLFPLRTEKQSLTSFAPAPPLFAGVTRLRIAEPAETWTAPRAMLAQLGPLAQLTHLHLARRAGANEDNDITFAADVAMLLRARPSLKVLAVSVFPPYLRPLPGTIGEADMDVDDEDDASEAERACRDSHIWALLAEIARVDRRLVLRCGAPDAWRKQWAGVEVVANASGPVDFWGTVARAQRKSTL